MKHVSTDSLNIQLQVEFESDARSASACRLPNCFSAHGKVVKAILVRDTATGESKGFAFLDFDTPENAAKAQAATNQQTLDGKVLAVELAKVGGH